MAKVKKKRPPSPAEESDQKLPDKVSKRREMRLKMEEERTVKSGPLVGTSGKGGVFRVLGSFHIEGPDETNPGMRHEVNTDTAEFESPLPLDELFPNKFLRLGGGKTRLGRDEDRRQIDSNVRDRPLPERIEDAEAGEAYAEDEESEDEAEEEPRLKSKKAKIADRMRDEQGEAAAIPEEGEEVDKAARIRRSKLKKAKKAAKSKE